MVPLGERGVDALAWESFGDGWITDAVKQLKLKDCRTLKAGYGDLPELSDVDFSRDGCSPPTARRPASKSRTTTGFPLTAPA